MNVAIVAIGIPGSGKTTALKPLAERYGLAYVSRDDIREELCGDAADQSRNKEVWEEAGRRSADALLRGQGVLLDSTFAEAWKRRDAITHARAHGARRVIGIYADTPLDEAKRRNAARDRVVPEKAIEWMHARLAAEPPSLADGFDALYALSELPAAEEDLKQSLAS